METHDKSQGGDIGIPLPYRFNSIPGKPGNAPLPFEAMGPCLAELRQQLARRQAMS